jgi:hypothetical protein
VTGSQPQPRRQDCLHRDRTHSTTPAAVDAVKSAAFYVTHSTSTACTAPRRSAAPWAPSAQQRSGRPHTLPAAVLAGRTEREGKIASWGGRGWGGGVEGLIRYIGRRAGGPRARRWSCRAGYGFTAMTTCGGGGGGGGGDVGVKPKARRGGAGRSRSGRDAVTARSASRAYSPVRVDNEGRWGRWGGGHLAEYVAGLEPAVRLARLVEGDLRRRDARSQTPRRWWAPWSRRGLRRGGGGLWSCGGGVRVASQ